MLASGARTDAAALPRALCQDIPSHWPADGEHPSGPAALAAQALTVLRGKSVIWNYRTQRLPGSAWALLHRLLS